VEVEFHLFLNSALNVGYTVRFTPELLYPQVQKPKEQIEVRECLLSFGAESVVFQVAFQKL
jgi:hypothetical protein